MCEMNDVVFIMPVLNKAILGHLIVMVFLSGLAIYIVLKSQKWITCFMPLIAVLPVLLYSYSSLYTMYHTRFMITSEGLTVESGFQCNRLDVNEIHDVCIPDFDVKPKLKTCGFALPGYRRGWFKLRNHERGLFFLSSFEKAVCVRTHEYVILLSVEIPEKFIDTARIYWHRKRKETVEKNISFNSQSDPELQQERWDLEQEAVELLNRFCPIVSKYE